SVARGGVTVIATMALSLTLGTVPDGRVSAGVPVDATETVADKTALAQEPYSLVAPIASARTTAAGTRTTARWTGAIDTRSKASVNKAYWAKFAPKLSLPIGWLGGSILGC